MRYFVEKFNGASLWAEELLWTKPKPHRWGLLWTLGTVYENSHEFLPSTDAET